MYPPQTSLIPTQIALFRFLDEQGLSAVFQNYPYWYFGSTPFRHLTGPIVSFLAVILKKIIPGSSYFDVFNILLLLGWLVGIFGFYHLFRSLTKANNNLSMLICLIYAFFPIMPFLLPFSNGIGFVAYSFLPLFFNTFLSYLRQGLANLREEDDDEKDEEIILSTSRKNDALIIIFITLLILLYSQLIPTLLIGIFILIMVEGKGKIEELAKKSFKLFGIAILFSTIWYGPTYWLTLLGSPSFGGQSLINVLASLSKVLPIAIALIVASFSAKVAGVKDRLLKLSLYWLLTFGILTIIRFISDPDYWLDWSGYSWEIQFALSLLIGGLILKKNLLVKLSVIGFVIVSSIVISQKWLILKMQNNLEKTVEFKISKQLEKIAKENEYTFLTGTSAYWLNSSFNIKQVRGGVDQSAKNKEWQKVAWQLKEGENLEKAIAWLKRNKVNYLIVHTDESREYYHDIKYPEGFESVEGLTKVYDDQGDIIYRLNNNKNPD